MSNFSHNGNLQEQNSYSDTESEPSGCDKTVAFLAALQETQNVLNVLLHAVLYRENTDSYECNISRINASSESEDEFKENQITSNGQIGTINVNGYGGNILVPTSITSKESIPTENSSIQDQVILLPWLNHGLFNRNSIPVNSNSEDRQWPAELILNNLFSKSDNTTVNKQNSCLSDEQRDSEQSPNAYKMEQEALSNREIVKYGITMNTHNKKLTDTYSILTRHPLEPPRPATEHKVFQNLKTLKNEKEEILQLPLEVNYKDYRNSSTNLEELGLQSIAAYDDEKNSETSDSKQEKELSELEEIKKLVKFSQSSYISCENKINSILSQIENHSKSKINMPHNESCANSARQNLSEPTTSNHQKEIGLRGETVENKKVKVRHLPPESIPINPSRCEKDMVGDDSAKTNTYILCECDHPGVAGGAVPVVTSFVVSQNKNRIDNNTPENKFQKEIRIYKSSTSEAENNLEKAKPSLIPKLTNSLKKSDRSSSLGRTEKQRCLVQSSNREGNEEKKPHVTINISSKMLSLQERLKATTSLIRQKISNSSENKFEHEKNKMDQNEKHYLRFDDESFQKYKRQKKLRNQLSKAITRVAQDANNLREISDRSNQIAGIDHLYQQITELRQLSNELSDIQSRDDEKTYVSDRSQDMNDSRHPSSDSGHKTKAKDKIYIKFLPTKIGIKKRKCYNTEVQTEATKDFVSNIIQSDIEMEKKSTGESSVKETDSMDGMFIPSSDEPPKMEEDENEDGLDITITFPEFQQHIMHQASSHLSVCFSDISAEALGRLKRCPKEFTLRMDFIQGKMFFESGRSPANNFSIGPDLKITECVLDNKMSDIISIKPSTECMYTSQIISVEGTKQKSSIKTLKSTDSELFNVVSLPTINRKTSGKTKSCITFKNERSVSTGCMLTERRSNKSMPQIPSLTKILEEPAMESAITSRAELETNSDISSATCTCPKGIKCHHIAALALFGHYNISVTDKACSWNAPSKPKSGPVKSAEELYPPKPYTALAGKVLEESLKILKEKFGIFGNTVGFTWLLNEEPVDSVNNFPIIEEIISSKEFLEATDKIKVFKEKCAINDQMVQDTAAATVGQATNEKWFLARKFRLTASNFGLIIAACARNKYPPSLFKTLLGEYNLDGVKAIQWGRTHEKDAIEHLKQFYNLSIKPTGVWLKNSGLLAASPDGLIEEEGAIVEVKCPYSFRNDLLSEKLRNNNKYVIYYDSDGTLILNTNHNYYHQIQGILHILKKKKCYLCIWTLKETVVTTIECDDEWKDNLELLENFYIEQYLPKLLENY